MGGGGSIGKKPNVIKGGLTVLEKYTKLVYYNAKLFVSKFL